MLKNTLSIVFLVLVVFSSSHASASPAQNLFSAVADSSRVDFFEGNEDKTIVRSKNVRLNFGALTDSMNARKLDSEAEGQAVVLLNLFDDATYYASLRMSGKSANGKSLILSGRLEGMDFGRVTFAINGDIASGMVTTDDGAFFEIRYTGSGMYSIIEVDRTQFPEVEHMPVRADAAEDSLSRNNYLVNDGDVVESGALVDDGSTIDIMVLYSSNSRAGAGGVEAIESRINLATEVTNQSFANSGIDVRVRVVYMEEVGYDDNAGYYSALKDVRGKYDGKLDFIHSKRDEHGADIVSLWIDNREYCGLGYQMTSESSFDKYAFNVVNYSCAVSTYAFAHEVGHNLGAAHDRDNTQGSALYPWSYGYRQENSNPRFYTVMSYPCSGCSLINFWSNPEINYRGWPTGEASVSDNRTTLNKTRSIAANWRSSVYPVAEQGITEDIQQ